MTVGQNVATKFRFTPDDPIEVGASVKVVGKKGILTYNGIVFMVTILGMVIGATLPIFAFTKYSFSVTKQTKRWNSGK